MDIRIVSGNTAIAHPIAVHLEKSLEANVQFSNSHVDRYEIVHRAGLPMQRVSELLASLQPLSPTVRMNSALEDVDFELHLGDSVSVDHWNISLYSDTEELSTEFASKLQSNGFSCSNNSKGYQQESKMLFGGASKFARQVIQWLAKQYNITLQERKDWSEEDNDIWIYLRHPKHDQLPPRKCFKVEIIADNTETTQTLMESLEEKGFTYVTTTSTESYLSNNRFVIEAGPFSQSESQSDLRQIEQLCSSYLEEKGINLERYPLQTKTDSSESLEASISLPLRQWEDQKLLPYAGPYPDRFELFIQTDTPERLEPLLENLKELGFAGVSLQTIRDSDPPTGFEITWGAASEIPHITSQLEQLTRDFLQAEVSSDDWDLYLNQRTEDESWAHKIQVSLPIDRAENGRLTEAILSHAQNFDLSIYSPELEQLKPLLDEMRTCNFKTFEANSECHEDSPLIRYGGALPALLEHIRSKFQPFLNHEITLQKSWDDNDDDIWIYLPRSAFRAEAPQASQQHRPDLQAWLAPDQEIAATSRSFIEVQHNLVRVGEISLPRKSNNNSSLAPDPSLFSHYCIDTMTAETLNFIATSVVMREPCLLEGETSTSKTSAVLYLASLLNQPVVRLNLNGQTDTSELIGRFVPDTEGNTQHAHQTTEALAASDNKELAAANTSSPTSRSPWRWQDGLIVQAMRQGWWVLLDEVNLAEPQILERLNSVLEQTPSLILTEFNNALIGPGGEPVHPDFRLFATMNPAEYEGRSTLSPAYRDRWRAYRFVPPPGETEYMQMLNMLVYGQQPEIVVMGQSFHSAEVIAPYSTLAEYTFLSPFFDALACFHASLEHAVRPQNSSGYRLGDLRRERYIFTRRGLLSFVDYLANLLPHNQDNGTRILRHALYRYYIARIAEANDQTTVVQLLDAVGIGPNQWLFDAQNCALVLLEVGPQEHKVMEKLLPLTDFNEDEARSLMEPGSQLFANLSLEEAQQHKREWEALGVVLELKHCIEEEENLQSSEQAD